MVFPKISGWKSVSLFLNEHRDLVKDQKKSDNSSDPLIDEAIKLFGEDLLEIRD